MKKFAAFMLMFTLAMPLVGCKKTKSKTESKSSKADEDPKTKSKTDEDPKTKTDTDPKTKTKTDKTS